MRTKKTIFYSVGISVLAHALFFTYATGVKIPGAYTVLARSKRFFNIKALQKERVLKKPAERITASTYAEALKFESPVYSESMLAHIDSEEKEAKKADLTLTEEKITMPAVARQEDLKPLIENKKDYGLLREKLRRDTREDLVEVAGLTDKDTFVRPGDGTGETELALDFLDKMPGFTPKMTGSFFGSAKHKAASVFGKGHTLAIKRKSDFVDLKEYLVCGLSTYQDPGDGQKYYKISITAGKDAASLPISSKEIIFLVDCSLSIQPDRLKEFKRGLRYCLRNLNPEDYFNIMAFKDEIVWYSPHSIKPSASSIQDALLFVGRLTATERTDTYMALHKSIQVKSTRTPSYIVLFSDGRPTYGMTDSRKIINEISDFNNGERPIFAFSGGARVNRYFLDFISYKNRGWTEYAPHTRSIAKYLANMYKKIKDPMFLNLRYRTSGLDNHEVVPKSLPDFFRNAEFTLFGKYTDEDEFSLQFLGDLNDKTSEFIVAGSLKKALKGDKDIARDWAFNKIYYLIGLLEYGKENRHIINEINSLCEKFDIKTPYSQELEE